jgi:hypothetical protein
MAIELYNLSGRPRETISLHTGCSPHLLSPTEIALYVYKLAISSL